MTDSIRIMVVEDDADVRESLSYILGHAEGIELAGSFPSGQSALDGFRADPEVDVVLVDLGLPDLHGSEVIRRLKALRAELDIVVLTVFGDDESLFAALRAGATGYLLKDTAPGPLVEALREAAAGGAPMSPSIARRVVEALHAGALPPDPLTPREHEVLEHLARGASYQEIGSALSMATSTVQTHIKAIYRKLEVASKAEATAEALRRGIIR